MSFGDLSSRTSPSENFTPSVIPQLSELKRFFTPLAANTAALRKATALLSKDEKQVDLKRIRALREQNRQIAVTAGNSVKAIDSLIDRESPDVIEAAQATKLEFHRLLDDFSIALTESVEAEKLAVGRNHDIESNGSAMNEQQVAIEQEQINRQAQETDSLLSTSQPQYHTAREAAIQREIQDNDRFLRERNAILVETQTSILEVNSIFRDLATMISDQGSQIEHIEETTAETAITISRTRRELEKTQQRREDRKKFFFCTLLSIALIIAVLLIILLS